MSAVTSETHISSEKAKAIFAYLDRLEDFVEGQDYWLCEDEDGGEFIQGYGDDERVYNHEKTSWSSPGFPVCVD